MQILLTWLWPKLKTRMFLGPSFVQEMTECLRIAQFWICTWLRWKLRQARVTMLCLRLEEIRMCWLRLRQGLRLGLDYCLIKSWRVWLIAGSSTDYTADHTDVLVGREWFKLNFRKLLFYYNLGRILGVVTVTNLWKNMRNLLYALSS